MKYTGIYISREVLGKTKNEKSSYWRADLRVILPRNRACLHKPHLLEKAPGSLFKLSPSSPRSNTSGLSAWSLASYYPFTALIAQLTRHRPKHFDVGLPGCARNRAVIDQTWFIYILPVTGHGTISPKFSRAPITRRLRCFWFPMRRFFFLQNKTKQNAYS